MKINTTGGVVTLTSETKEEAITLFSYGLEQGNAPEKRVHKKHKRHVFKKECDVCGFMAKAGPGLASHKRSAHPLIKDNTTVEWKTPTSFVTES
jgi:hypothetical protein